MQVGIDREDVTIPLQPPDLTDNYTTFFITDFVLFTINYRKPKGILLYTNEKQCGPLSVHIED